MIATAGHVDHGKSSLVRALTGMEPDRWAEEKRRGMTLDLGFAWTRLPVAEVAFVDVPGHERFVPTMLAGIESRGFLVAAPLALKLGCGFAMLRKPGKLPGPVTGLDYALEYGTDRLEIQADAIPPGARVVLVDDLLATGGTMAAGIALLRQAGAEVPAVAALIELTFLGGRARLDVPCEALVAYDE